MKFLKNISFLFLLWGNCIYASDLPSDTIALDEIEIIANRLVNFTTGSKVQKINSSDIIPYYTSNLSDILSELTTISIKSYGLTGLSSVSLRGMSSKHTAVLWNGFNLQSSMNGSVDMNSVPTFLIDEIDIQYGGSGALFGSGAIGGIIHLNNSLKLDNKIELGYNQSFGSFNNFFEGLKFNYSNKKFASSTRAYHKSGKNDFEFINTQQFGKPKVKQENSASKQYGILQSNLIKINSKQSLTTNIWAQDFYREIPAMMTSSISAANENSELLRFSATWNKNGEISSWYTRFYYNYESLVYRDSLIDLVSKMKNNSLIGEIENKISIKNNFLLNIGINNTYDKVNTANYGIDQFRNRTAIYSSFKYFNNPKTFAAILSIREELVDNEFTPFTFSLSSRYHVNKFINLNTNISKNYNLPALNDLYWVPGGNPELKSESGWSEDFGVSFNHSYSRNFLKINISVFNINLNNHVIWLPTSSNYWSAENVEKLWSRGVETSLNYTYKISDFKLSTSILYAYTKSTYEKSENTEESSVGKQLMYIPEHKGNAGLKASYKWLNVRYIHSYVGRRYITKDNSGSVDPYQVADLALSGVFKLKASDLNINLKINNIWNETYEVMAFYAMPLRYYSISLSYNFNKQLN
jgi:iron complex outermembrane receptor protein